MSPKMTRPAAMPGFTIERYTHCGKIFITVTAMNNRPFEIFIRFGKAGGCGSAMGDGLARLMSYGLRSGLEPKDAVKALEGIGCHHGPHTCMNEIAAAIRLVLETLETGRDLNELIEEEAFAGANSGEEPIPVTELMM